MNQREQLLQFIDQAMDGGAHIKIHFCEREDTRAKALMVSEIFNEITGAEVLEMPGKYFTSEKNRVQFLHHYYGEGPIVIKI